MRSTASPGRSFFGGGPLVHPPGLARGVRPRPRRAASARGARRGSAAASRPARSSGATKRRPIGEDLAQGGHVRGHDRRAAGQRLDGTAGRSPRRRRGTRAPGRRSRARPARRRRRRRSAITPGSSRAHWPGAPTSTSGSVARGLRECAPRACAGRGGAGRRPRAGTRRGACSAGGARGDLLGRPRAEHGVGRLVDDVRRGRRRPRAGRRRPRRRRGWGRSAAWHARPRGSAGGSAGRSAGTRPGA